MKARRMIFMALFILGAVTLIAAGFTLADPANINNPPTEDWFFDSGSPVVISHKTWDMNYNITVANYTTLTFSDCTLTFGDPDDLNSRWIQVWWNGSMIVTDSTFKGKGTVRYYMELENTTTFIRSDISGLKPPNTSAGGITAWDSMITFTDTDVSGETLGYGIRLNNCQLTADGLRLTDSGEGDNYWRQALYIDISYTNWDDVFRIDIRNSNIDDNLADGLRIRTYYNRATTVVSLTDSTFDRNGGYGLNLNNDYSQNGTLEFLITNCTFVENEYAGLWWYAYDHNYDGTGALNVTIEGTVFQDNGEGGAFIGMWYSDADHNVIVDGCTFQNNGLVSQGWSFGGLRIEYGGLYSGIHISIDTNVFVNNAEDGLYLWMNSGMEDDNYLTITDCDFSDSKRQGIFIHLERYYDFLGPISVDGCSFTDNGEGGIFIEHGYMQDMDYNLDVTDCTFTGINGGGVTSTSRSSGEDSDGVTWTIKGSTFEHLGGYAIDLYLEEVMGGATLDIYDCVINDTNGIRFLVMDSWSSVEASHLLEVEMVDITETNGPAIEAMAYGFYGLGFNVFLTDVTIDIAIYDGIKALASTNYLSTTHAVNMLISVKDVTVSNIEGNGLNLGTDKINYRGERDIDVDNLDVSQTQRAVTVSGLKGEFAETTITGSNREDFMFIGANVELYEPNLDSLDSGAVLIVESGSAKFWYRLNVKVEWDTGQWVENAIVEIMDNHHSVIGTYTQMDPSGIPELFLNSYQFRETGQFTRSPYLLNVTFNDINEGASVLLDQNKEVTIKIQDHAPPKVFINEPLPDHIQRSTSIEVRGSSFDSESSVRMVEVSIDGIEWIDTTGTTSWSHTFTVSHQDVIDNGGMFVIRARGWDFANNSFTTLIVVEVDPFPPELRIDFPSNGYQTNVQTVEVRGVTEDGATMLVNGVETPVIGTLFSADVDLVEGPNTITVTSFDFLGNSQSIKMEVVLDTKQPYVVLLTPDDNEMFTERTCLVSGQAEDDLVISVNGAILTSGQYNNGTFNYVLNLNRGENLVMLEATDTSGNHLILTRLVILDDVMPMLAIQAPMEVNSYQSDLVISVIGTTDPDSIILINDELITLDHGLFNHAIVGIIGPNIIQVQALDLAGNLVTTEMTVTIDVEPPTFDITQPESVIDIVRSSDYILEGTTDGAKEIDVNGVTYPIVSDGLGIGTFSIPVTLLEGANPFVITITDEAENSVVTERRIFMDTLPPALVVRISGLHQNDAGENIYKTDKGKPGIMTITGFTDDAIQVRINGELVPVSTQGYFVMDYSMNVNEVNSIEVTVVDVAGNEATWDETVKHAFFPPVEDDGFSWGYVVLILGLVLLIFAIIAGWWRLGKTEPEMEMRDVEDDEVLAPAAMPEVEEEEDLEEEEEEEEEEEVVIEEEEEEEVHELAPPTERPRTETSRPDSGPSEDVTIEIDEKELEEKDADAEIGADDTDQEGI